MSYKSATFEFELERYLDKNTNEYFVGEDINFPNNENEFEFKYVLIPVTVSGYSNFSPGRYCGPPELCYPDEGEIIVEEVVDKDNNDWLDKLTSNELDRIEEMIAEKACDDD